MSISSSRLSRYTWPWVGVLALLLILMADALIFRVLSPWSLLLERAGNRYNRDVIEDRIQLEKQAEQHEKVQQVALFGTSRMQRMWRERYSTLVNRTDLQLLNYAHPNMSPADVLSAAEAMAGMEPDVVILGLSELDLHNRSKLKSRSSFPSIARFVDLAAALGWDSLWSERQELLRIAAGKVLLSYRFRKQLDSAFFGIVKEFPGTRPNSPTPSIPPDTNWLLQQARALPPDWNNEPARERLRHMQINSLINLRGGAQLELQQSFVRDTIQRFTHAGSRVVILELPVYPAARRLYDPKMRGSFLNFAAQMERDFGVRLIPLEQQPGYPAYDFADFMHVGKRAAYRATPFIEKVILEELAVSEVYEE